MIPLKAALFTLEHGGDAAVHLEIITQIAFRNPPITLITRLRWVRRYMYGGGGATIV